MQESALRVITKHGDDVEISDADVATLSPALGAATYENDAGMDRADTDLDDCARRSAALPPAVRERWKIDMALGEVAAGRFPRLAAPPPCWGDPIEPMPDDPTELAATIGEMIGREAQPIESHRMLAAATRTSRLPVEQRADVWRPYGESRRRDLPYNHYQPWPQELVGYLAHYWSTPPHDVRPIGQPTWLPQVASTLTAICGQLIWHKPGTQLLSEPTHTSGAVDPSALLTRLCSVSDDHPDFDIELAALKLPRDLDNRFWKDALEVNPVSAARLLQHYGNQEPPSLTIKIQEQDRYFMRTSVEATTAAGSPIRPAPGIWGSLLDVNHLSSRNRWGGVVHDSFVWGWAALAPWHSDLVAAHLAQPLRAAMDTGSYGGIAPRSAAELDAPTGTLGATGHMCLALALQACDATTRTPAADVWFAAAADGRLTPALMAEALISLHRVEELRLNRFIQSVATTTADPVVAARTLAVLMLVAPPLLEAKARHIHLLLDLAADLAARVGTADVPAHLRDPAVPRSSATVTAARRRLANVPPMGPERIAAGVGALSNLLDRLG